MRISDWSSDVCSSDLLDVVVRQPEKICARPTALPELEPRPPRLRIAGKQDAPFDHRDSKIGIIHAIEKTVDHGVIEQHVVRRGNEQRITCFRSEEHTSELQSLMRISYAVFCLKKKKNTNTTIT